MDMNRDETNIMTGRMYLVLGLMLLLPCAIVFQILRIQVLEGEQLRSLWSQQAIDTVPIQAERGEILDRHGRMLATNSVSYQVAVDPHYPAITVQELERVYDILASDASNSPSHYRSRVDRAGGSRYVVLERAVDRDLYNRLSALDMPGLILEESYQRRYNYDQLAAHALGFVNHELEGQMGLEGSYNEHLKGRDGLQQVRRDRNNRIREVVGAPRRQPEQGNTLKTTLDAQVQAMVESELQKGVERTGARSGTVIVMEPHNGAIRAMANYPSFNPNTPSQAPERVLRNTAISDMMEPGSTFKLVTGVAALEQQVVEMDERFDTPEQGQVRIHGQLMSDHDPLGELTFPEVIYKSSNIAISEIAMRLEPDTFYQYARNMGFGASTGVDLPNEMPGRLSRPHQWSRVTLPWMSTGYEVQVTPMQLTQAYAALANDGKIMQPRAVEKVLDGENRVVERNRPRTVRQAMDRETVEQLKPVFEKVVSDSGTAGRVRVEGLSIAGKTGTAQKLIDGSYQNRYRSSFIGFFPLDEPRYVALVVLDEPQTTFYGGHTAGPIFRNIATRIIGMDDQLDIHEESGDEVDPGRWVHIPNLKHLQVEQAGTLVRSLGGRLNRNGEGSFIRRQHPEPGSRVLAGDQVTVELQDEQSYGVELVSDNHGTVPDVTGMGMRRAVNELHRRGYEVNIIGSGSIHAQFPESGAQYRKGREVTVRGNAPSLRGQLSQPSEP